MSIDLADFKEIIMAHMQDQPFETSCADCGKTVALDITVDRDFDMTITVPVCKCAKREE